MNGYYHHERFLGFDANRQRSFLNYVIERNIFFFTEDRDFSMRFNVSDHLILFK